MKFSKVALMGLGIGVSLVFTGCGGGGDDLTATGKLTQEKAEEIGTVVLSTEGLSPEGLLKTADKSTSSSEEKELDAFHMAWYPAGDQNCSVSGSFTKKVLSGVTPWEAHDSEEEIESSTYKFEVSFKECDNGWGYKVTGTSKVTYEWKEEESEESERWIENLDETRENFVMEIDPTHKLTFSSFTLKESYDETTYTSGDWKYVEEGKYSWSGTLVDGNETVEFKNISAYEKENEASTDGNYSENEEGEISGMIKDSETEGWIVVETPEMIESKDGKCPHAGEITISGADHTASYEFNSDYTVTFEMDGKVVKTYKDCNELTGEEETEEGAE